MTNIFYATAIAVSSIQISHAAFSWTAASDDNSDPGGGFVETDLSSFALDVTDIADFPAAGDGFDLNIDAVGGNFDLDVNGQNGNRSARFTITIPDTQSNITAVNFSVAYDSPIAPINPGGSGQSEALTWLQWRAGEDIIADLGITLASGAFDNPTIVAGNDSTFNGNGNFTINPTDDSFGAFRRQVGVFSIDNLTTDGSISAIDYTITPEDGGTFAPGSIFIITLDGNLAVPEPSSSVFLALGGLALLSLRRRKS